MKDNTKKMLEFFYEISKIPRESGNEGQIASYLENFAKERNLECYRDKQNNVLIKRIMPFAKDTIILQAHLDMVCVKNENSNHNFNTDAIEIIEDGDFIKANGTSLGADDGIGVAMILFLLDYSEINNVNLECLFTTEEETTFEGASTFDYSKLSGKKLINFDGCEDDTIVTACDGDYATKYIANFDRVWTDLPTYKIKVSNLKGGNSGIEIEKNRVNAIVLMAKILKELGDIYIANINGGNSEINIATDCECIIATNNINKISTCRYEFEEEYPIITVDEAKTEEVFSVLDSKKIVDEILTLKKDIITGDIHKIITFGNIGKIATHGNEISLETFVAGNNYEDLNKCLEENNNISKLNSFISKEIYNDSIWEQKEKSELRDKFSDVYYKLYNERPKIKNSHGLLECSCFAKRIENLDMISVGTIIEDFHTVNEKIYISSCEKILDIIIEFMKSFSS